MIPIPVFLILEPNLHLHRYTVHIGMSFAWAFERCIVGENNDVPFGYVILMSIV